MQFVQVRYAGINFFYTSIYVGPTMKYPLKYIRRRSHFKHRMLWKNSKYTHGLLPPIIQGHP
jgi:hypothetical protein